MKFESINEKMTISLSPLLSEAIQKIDINKTRDQNKKILKSPWVRLPNVRKFEIKLNHLDPLFGIFGIKKRYKPSIVFEPYEGHKLNRYLEHQILRLSKNKSNPKIYWKLSKILMKRSNVFRISAINHVFKNWYRNYPLSFILNTNRKLSKLINNSSDQMDYHRVYIPKGEKGYRPLGVPNPEWRLYLHMYSQFLTFFFMDKLPNQHGFLPEKGTLTAWIEIFTKGLIDKPYIKEWDFKNYFNEIHCNKISELLLKEEIPKEIVYFLENINRSKIELKDEDLVDETKIRKQQESQKDIKEGKPNSEMLSGIRDFIEGTPDQHQVYFKDNNTNDINDYKRNQIEMLRQFMLEDETEDVHEYVQLQWALLDSYKPSKIDTDFNGVAQGSPTSPILANLIMNEWIMKHKEEDCIAYADDSVSFSDKEINISIPEDTGIIINEEKSGYVKYAGKWLKPLKFLGLEYDGKIFRAKTRKGSTLAVTARTKLMIETIEEVKEDQQFESIQEAIDFLYEQKSMRKKFSYPDKLTLGGSWEKYFKSRLIGFIQSRLYNGDWNLKNIEQDFSLNFVNGSWMDTKLNKGVKDIFVASSYANHSLLNILRYNQKLRKPRKDDLTIRHGKNV